MFGFLRSFVCSKSIAFLALYLACAAMCSAAVGYGFHRSSFEKFRVQKSEEKITALRLVDAFVTTYGNHRGDSGSSAAVPATFGAKAIERFNSEGGAAHDFVLRWVGRSGREIRTPPADPEMARTVESFGDGPDPQPHSSLTRIDGRRIFRTVYPSVARDEACVSCHNGLRPDRESWKLNDVMGAFAVDVPVDTFFAQNRKQALDIGFGLFAALALVGLVVAALQHRQMQASLAADSDLRQVNQSLEAATKAKSDFLANMSHEIRTPMNGVFGMTDLLLKTRLTDHQYRLVSTINQSAKTLLTIINDILDISRIESGKVTLEKQSFEFRPCVEGAVDLFLDTAGRKGLSLSLYVAPSVPQRIVADAGRLRQVFVNLIGNAVKFTPAGEVGLRVTVGSDAEGKEVIHVEITDTGIGMHAATVEKLGTPFEQADPSITRRFGGTGLGLSISRHIVDLMGGKLELMSAPGRGTLVQFTIPLERDETEAPVSPGVLDGTRILVIDEYETSRSIICDYLDAAGAEPVQATSGREGLELLRIAADSGFPFDAVVVEALVADADGLDFLAAKADDRRHDAVKSIVLTSMSWPGDVSEIRKRGAHALLAKPISERVLTGSIAAALGRGEMPSVEGTAASSQTPDRDFRRLNARVLLAEDNPVNVEVAKAYLADFGCSVRVAENGREAVEAHAEQGFDLILMDAQMPDLDGLSATRIIREREAAQGLAPIPIIAVTANAFDEDRKRCLEAGMNDYLSKPYSEAQLATVLEKWTIAQAATRSSAAPVRPSTPLPLAAIVAKLRSRGAQQPVRARRLKRVLAPVEEGQVAEDVKVLSSPQHATLRSRMVAAYIDHAPNAHASMKAALERCDAVAVKLAAHSLKASSASLGAHELARLLAMIEKAANTGDLYECTTQMARLDPELSDVLATLSEEVVESASAVAM